jgi:hypothetical protein
MGIYDQMRMMQRRNEVDEEGEVLDEACAGDMDNKMKIGKWMRYQMAMGGWFVIRAADDLNWVARAAKGL